MNKYKKFAVKHGKKVGAAALTAVKQTASTFGPGKKIKVAYKAGQIAGKTITKANSAIGKAINVGTKISKPVVKIATKKLQNVYKQPTSIENVINVAKGNVKLMKSDVKGFSIQAGKFSKSLINKVKSKIKK
tara:strand:- start:780 stop:1175 length:396 start_codon:yes stop_codon:yes gene_type:complete